ncbi:MAG: DUF3859 domain-containing protein [Pseudomonas sp.]|uniref:DUF3859 domain-containing protein n=1 Tax=Pseudomonas sp. TaxID=306 RepID=UPI00271B8EE4|nr:DUF3859 domain-containing protein [Pseudomonas sp.]MDO9618038.1 DUF3859 domain-containing protein [Pseudomonas sp.]MDP2447586.1 DUF3859 domain-containing protein [Pseudomonas sp.]MDZ4336042.1 DUF3859 domain-containing protein [Pseudomonas sp.]
MQYTRFSALAALVLTSSLAQAEVRVDGPVEYGVFASDYQDFQEGERVLTRSNQQIELGEVIPAKLGTKFGLRYSLAGKVAEDSPLTLLYLTPGVVTPQGTRHDKFVVTQKPVPGAPQDVMAFEFTEMHEVVPGEWHFMVFQDDRKLLEQRFIVR